MMLLFAQRKSMCCQKTTNPWFPLRWAVLKSAAGLVGLLVLIVGSGEIGAKPQDGAQRSRPSFRATVDNSVLTIDQTPFFARVIQHNGESFQFLSELGFNTIQLPAAPSLSQLTEARRLGLWLVCPPPSSVGLQLITSQYDPVLAWSVGENARGRHVQSIRESIREIRESDRYPNRPVVAHVRSYRRAIGTQLDIVSIGRASLYSSVVAKDYSLWIARHTDNQNKPFWIDLPTQIPVNLKRQVAAFGGDLAYPIEHQQLKHLLYEAITGGGRGLRFRSNVRLDQSDARSMLRAQTLQWLLGHLDQIDAWAAGGLVTQISSANDGLEIYALRKPGSKLLLIQRPTGAEQWAAGDVPLKTISFQDVSSSVSDRSYLIDEIGASPLEGERFATGMRLQIPNCPFVGCVLQTQDPRIVQGIEAATKGNQQRSSAMLQRLELSQQWLAVMQGMQQQWSRAGIEIDFVEGELREAAQQVARAVPLMRRGSPNDVLRILNQSDYRLALVRRELIRRHNQGNDSVVTSPLLLHFGGVRAHIQLGAQLAASQWNPNSLTGGDFENLEQMTDAGWINRRESLDGLQTRIELTSQAAVDGNYGMKMSVQSSRPWDDDLVPTPPVWITSAPINARAGQLVRLHGYVNVPVPLTGTFDGLLVTDSLGGSETASRFRQTNGWQEFTLYRAVSQSGPVTITFSMTGVGEALIDEVTIRTLDVRSANGKAVPSQTHSQAHSQQNEIK